MPYMSSIDLLWTHAANPATRARSRSPSPVESTPNAARLNQQQQQQRQQEQQAEIAAQAAKYAARGDHLLSRGPHADRARLIRVMQGLPPVGSSAEADDLSDEEEMWEVRKEDLVRYGHRWMTLIGTRRTAYEEELSNEEVDEHGRSGTGDGDGSSSDAEGGPGEFVGGHTGHAAEAAALRQEQLERQRRQDVQDRAEARARNARANRHPPAPAEAQEQEEGEGEEEGEEEEGGVDLDASVEDMDA